MIYSYDRQKIQSKNASALLPWGSMVFDWLGDLTNFTIKQAHAIVGGNLTGAKKLHSNGVFATIDDALFRGDLTGTVFVSAEWDKSAVSFRVWADHPMRGNIDITRSDIGYTDRPDALIEHALKTLRSL